MMKFTFSGIHLNGRLVFFILLVPYVLYSLLLLPNYYMNLFHGSCGFSLYFPIDFGDSHTKILKSDRLKNDTHFANIGLNNKGTEKILNFDACSGRYIYIHNLPSRFNEDLKKCPSLRAQFIHCNAILNMGFGPQAMDDNGFLPNNSWHVTNQFSLEIIFHNKMTKYKCLTNDSSTASAIFVPYYAGLDVGHGYAYHNMTMRNLSPQNLLKWLRSRPEWNYMWGQDHFFVGGRVTWDFRLKLDEDNGWGNQFKFMPGATNMTMLTIEGDQMRSDDVSIPYPTYFHPSSKREIIQWQKKMRRQTRHYLHSFVGAPRENESSAIRAKIINLCSGSKVCLHLDCKARSSGVCQNPVLVMNSLANSTFCLQPSGDSSTRRSTFDAILAGCIPVFFKPDSAYVQYLWHLPKNHTKYSVFIPEGEVLSGKVDIEKSLCAISEREVLEMREEVIKLIPKIIYADPRHNQEAIEDAFQIAIEQLLKRIKDTRKKMKLES